jgi:hypothetical protein
MGTLDKVLAACLIFVAGYLLAGCAMSPLRQHATAARMTMVTLEGAGLAIEEATRLAIERCDGSASCIEGVGEQATTAAAARDALIPAAHAYRDAVLASDGEEAPGVVAYLGVVARRLAEGWPTLAAALSALGLPVPSIAFPVTPEVE